MTTRGVYVIKALFCPGIGWETDVDYYLQEIYGVDRDRPLLNGAQSRALRFNSKREAKAVINKYFIGEDKAKVIRLTKRIR